MVESSSEIMREIESHCNKLGEDLSDLESRVLESAEWRTHYEKHPLWFVGAAFGGGLLLSGLFSGRCHGSTRYPPGNTAADRNGGQKSALSQVLDNVKTAMIGFGVVKAKEVLADVWPGYRQHLRQTEPPDPGRNRF